VLRSHANKIKEAVYTGVLATALLAAPTILRAQDAVQNQTPNTQAQSQQAPVSTDTSPKVSGVFFDTTQALDGTLTNQSSTKDILNLGGSNQLWFVGGQLTKFPVVYSNSTGFDLGLKYVNDSVKTDSTWVRFTAFNDYGNQSYSSDWDVRLPSFSRNLNLSILGDVDQVFLSTDKVRHLDHSIGGKLNVFKYYNIIFANSERGIKSGKSQAEGLRLGGEFNNNKNALAAFLVDKQNNTYLYSALAGFNYKGVGFRYIGSDSPSTKTYGNQVYLSFGNQNSEGIGGLPQYTITQQLSNQFIESSRYLPGTSIVDSDNTNRFSTPPTNFITTTGPGRWGDFLRFKYNESPKDNNGKGGHDFDVYNTHILRLGNSGGVVGIEEVTKDNLNINHYGGGAGYKIDTGRITLTGSVVAQTNDSITGTLIINFK